MNKITKNVSVVFCHESDTLKPAPVNPAPSNDILLVDKKDGSFEIQVLDASGEPVHIAPKDVALCVLTSDASAVVAEEPTGTTFRLSRGKVGGQATITVTADWKTGRSPSTFQLVATTNDDKVAVVLADSNDAAFIDADIRPTSPKEPQASTIRKRADDIKAKRKAEIEAKAKKPVPHALPAHPVVELHPVKHHEEPEPVQHKAVLHPPAPESHPKAHHEPEHKPHKK